MQRESSPQDEVGGHPLSQESCSPRLALALRATAIRRGDGAKHPLSRFHEGVIFQTCYKLVTGCFLCRSMTHNKLGFLTRYPDSVTGIPPLNYLREKISSFLE